MPSNGIKSNVLQLLPEQCKGVMCLFFLPSDVLLGEGLALNQTRAGHGAAGLQLPRPHGASVCSSVSGEVPDRRQTVSVPNPAGAGTEHILACCLVYIQ